MTYLPLHKNTPIDKIRNVLTTNILILNDEFSIPLALYIKQSLMLSITTRDQIYDM